MELAQEKCVKQVGTKTWLHLYVKSRVGKAGLHLPPECIRSPSRPRLHGANYPVELEQRASTSIFRDHVRSTADSETLAVAALDYTKYVLGNPRSMGLEFQNRKFLNRLLFEYMWPPLDRFRRATPAVAPSVLPLFLPGLCPFFLSFCPGRFGCGPERSDRGEVRGPALASCAGASVTPVPPTSDLRQGKFQLCLHTGPHRPGQSIRLASAFLYCCLLFHGYTRLCSHLFAALFSARARADLFLGSSVAGRERGKMP